MLLLLNWRCWKRWSSFPPSFPRSAICFHKSHKWINRMSTWRPPLTTRPRLNVFSDSWRAPQQSPRKQNVFLGLLQRFHYKVCVLAGAEIGLYHQWDHVMRFKGSVRGQEWNLKENRADHYKGAEKKKITRQAKMEPFLNPSQLSDASIWPRADRKVFWRGRQKKIWRIPDKY